MIIIWDVNQFIGYYLISLDFWKGSLIKRFHIMYYLFVFSWAEKNMADHPETSSCKCGLGFGVFSLSKTDSQTSLLNKEQFINFHGRAGEYNLIKVKEKAEEIKKDVSNYYLDPDCKVIAIPYYPVIPEKPTVVGKEGRKTQDAQLLDNLYDKLLYHVLLKEAINSKIECLIINNFHGQQLIKKGKNTRQDKFAEFNKYEKQVMEILGIEEIPDEELDSCIEEHFKWKQKEIVDFKNELFKQE